MTLHPYGMDWALYDFVDEPWMDVVGYQSAHGDNEAYLRWIPEGPPSHTWNLQPARPFINLEPPYEGHLATSLPAAVRRRHGAPSHLLESPRLARGRRGLRRARRLGLGRRHRHTLRPRVDRTVAELAGGAQSAGRDLAAASGRVDGFAALVDLRAGAGADRRSTRSRRPAAYRRRRPGR